MYGFIPIAGAALRDGVVGNDGVAAPVLDLETLGAKRLVQLATHAAPVAPDGVRMPSRTPRARTSSFRPPPPSIRFGHRILPEPHFLPAHLAEVVVAYRRHTRR